MSQALKLRCGRHWILAPALDVLTLQPFGAAMAPAGPRRVDRQPLTLDGRILLGEPPFADTDGRVVMQLGPSLSESVRIIVDLVEGLVETSSGGLSPLPPALYRLRPYFNAVWSEGEFRPIALRLRPAGELPMGLFALRRRMRRAALRVAS